MIEAARREALGQMPLRLRLGLARLYVEEVDAALLRFADGVLSQDDLSLLLELIQAALERYAERATGLVRTAMLRAARYASDAHFAAMEQIAPDVAAGVRGSFAGIPARAVEAALRLRQLGVAETYKTLTKYAAQRHRGQIESAVMKSVARGDTYEQATKRIMRALAQSDPYLRDVVRKYGTRGGLRRHLSGREDYDPAEAAAARRIGYDARRIALTEIHVAYHEGDRLAVMESPVAAGQQWQLSGRHVVPDVCDVYAKHDAYGQGPGVFTGGAVPVVPHPFCRCPRITILRPESEWGTPKREPAPPRLPSAGDVASCAPGITAKAARRALRQSRADIQTAYQTSIQ